MKKLALAIALLAVCVIRGRRSSATGEPVAAGARTCERAVRAVTDEMLWKPDRVTAVVAADAG